MLVRPSPTSMNDEWDKALFKALHRHIVEAVSRGMTVLPVDLQSSFTVLPVCAVTSKGWVQTRLQNAASGGGVHLTGCYDRSYGLRQPLFAFISLGQAEWDNKMESRGGLGFFEYVSSFKHQGGYLSSDRAGGPPSSQPACLSTDTLVCWWLMQREMMSDSVILLVMGRYLSRQVLN